MKRSYLFSDSVEEYSPESSSMINREDNKLYVDQKDRTGYPWKEISLEEEEIIRVRQREFAYLNQDIREKLGVAAIEINDIFTCMGVGIIRENAEIALAHLDGYKPQQLEYFLEKTEKRLQGEVEESILVGLEETERFNRCYDILSSRFGKEKAIKILGQYNLDANENISLGADSDGFYLPKNTENKRKGREGPPADKSELIDIIEIRSEKTEM